MNTIGTLAIYFALYLAILGVGLSIVAGKTKLLRFRLASRFAVFTVTASVGLAAFCLLYGLLTHDFSSQYISEFSDRTMPLFYLIGAFWGGQAGSLLFWTLVVSIFTTLCVWINQDRYREFMPWVIMVCLGVTAGLLYILAFASNPFEGYRVIQDPVRGEGLNPLLQTPKMVLHPPALLTGLASMTVPFGFAIAALITGNTSSKWVEAARKWILIPWLFLSVGNILGGMWAYEELGWGGYWAWDPVENAAFMPWLMATALIHSLMIQERRGMLKRWNIGLMIGTFLLTVFGTYITRSGLIESIHTFAQSDIGGYFLTLLISLTVFSFGLFIYRWPDLEEEKRLKSVASREAAFMFNNWIFLAMTLVVLYGTMRPRIGELLTGQKVSIGPAWFNQWMIPLGIALLFLMGIGTVIAWRESSLEKFKRNFFGPILSTVLVAPSLISIYWFTRGADLAAAPDTLNASYAIATVAGCVFVASTIVQEFYRGVDARRRAHGESIWQALFALFKKQRRRYGGYVVHMGVVFAFLAFSGNALKESRDVSIKKGESVSIADYTLTYEGLDKKRSSDKLLVSATLSVKDRNTGKELYDLRPGKAIFHARPNMPTSEIDIHSTPLEDVYAALVNFSPPNGERIALKLFVSPFTWWFWLACGVILFGTLICLWPTVESVNRWRENTYSLGRTVVFWSLVGVCFSPVAIWQVESHTEWGSSDRFMKEAVEASASSHRELSAVVDPSKEG